MNTLDLIHNIHIDEQQALDTLHLTSNESMMSKTAAQFLNSPLSYRYFLGTQGDRTVDFENQIASTGGSFMFKCYENLVKLEAEAIKSANKMYSSVYTDFRPVSGLHAGICTISSLTKVGDIIYSIDPKDGGHFASKHYFELLGRKSEYIPWDNKTLNVDLEKFARKIKKTGVDFVYLELGTPLFPIDLKSIRKMVGPKVIIVYDASHTLGLIAGKKYQDPLNEGADVVQGNTHKTMLGPQKGMICVKNENLAKRLKNGISGGLVSSQHIHHSLCLYVAILEMEQFGLSYVEQMLKNAQVFGKELINQGFHLFNVDGVFTTSHELLIKPIDGSTHFEMCKKLHRNNISTNARTAFGEPIIRVGVQEVTRRGMKENEMKQIAQFFKNILFDHEDIKNEIIDFNSNYKDVHYSFDTTSI